MKGKLIKTDNQYYCFDENTVIVGTTDKSLLEHKPLATQKLSIKNCEAIELGYDLDELALDYYKLVFGNTKSYKDGFQKALEILGDKKFSLGQLKTSMDMARVMIDGKYANSGEEIIQSLQQTEWQVEVVMDRIPADLAPGGWDVFPKLDAESCLILKRVE